MRMMQLQDQGIKSKIYNNYKGQICSILFKNFFINSDTTFQWAGYKPSTVATVLQQYKRQ